jgi:phage tail sheath gpL-like
MALTGVDPLDPVPSDRRELIFGAGPGNGGSPERGVVFVGNITSAGTATVSALTEAIVDETDAIAKAGRRSELFRMWKAYTAVDTGAKIKFCPSLASAGSAATRTITLATTATASSSLKIELVGESIEVPISEGDTAIVVAAAVAAAINAASEGTWPVTAAQGAPANDHIVTLTTANLGPRNLLIVERLRTTFTKSCGMTSTLGASAGGATEDDATAAISTLSNAENYHWVLPFHSTSAPTATDNQIGEAITAVVTQALPINGKEQTVHVGLVGTQAQATTVATASPCNTVRATFWHAENSDWTPGMLAAHHCAVVRSQQVAHPSANIAGYTSTDATIYTVPAPFLTADRPTEVEKKADVNNGVSPVGFRGNGRPYIVRHVTSRSLNAQGLNDYKAREGHITSAIDFAWGEFKGRLAAVKQPFVADNPAEGKKPTPRTTTPDIVKAEAFSLIDDLAGPNPLGLYNGPILAPDKIDEMKASVVCTKTTGGISISMDLFAVEHLLSTSSTIRSVGPAY